MGAGYHTIHHTVYKHNYGKLAQFLCLLTIATCQQCTNPGPFKLEAALDSYENGVVLYAFACLLAQATTSFIWTSSSARL
jgi:hypothetical protein